MSKPRQGHRQIADYAPGCCPRCGPGAGYEIRWPVRGPWISHITPDGYVDSTDLDSITYGEEPKTVVCDSCGKRYQNPNLVPGYPRVDDVSPMQAV